jgi:hypothetical protein
VILRDAAGIEREIPSAVAGIRHVVTIEGFIPDTSHEYTIFRIEISRIAHDLFEKVTILPDRIAV